MLYAEFHYHKMASVKSLLVIVLILAAIVPEVIETSSADKKEKKEKKKCFVSQRSCQYRGGKVHWYKCRSKCKEQDKRSSACHKIKERCYGCECFTSDTPKSPRLQKRTLEEKPLLYIYRLLMKYIKKIRDKPKELPDKPKYPKKP